MTDRWAVQVEYQGTAYQGWQYQGPVKPSVQKCVEQALSAVANEAVKVYCAGRTDTGVHATHQIIHFDTLAERPEKAWVRGGNVHLPSDIAFRRAVKVTPDFHARFSAAQRHYLYCIINDPLRHAIGANQFSREHRPLDAERMHEAAQHLLGEQDFSSFRSSQCQSSTPMRNIAGIAAYRVGELVLMEVKANAFLHHMVRNLAGVLMDIGAGERPVNWIRELLDLKDRNAGGVTASPAGLYLVNVSYPGKWPLNWGPTAPPGVSEPMRLP